jgi:dihydrofolate reductase
MYLTRVDGIYEGDTYFPPFDASQWTLVSSEPSKPAQGTPSCTFQVLERVA